MKKTIWFMILLGASGGPSLACDLCSIYSATEARGEIGKGFFGGVAEQYTHFGTLQDNGHEVANEANQWLDSSISQLFLGYNFTERFGVQFNVPIIYRDFRRPEGGIIENGTESGLGDVTLTAHYQVLRYETKKSTLAWTILGGIKFPTKNNDQLTKKTNKIKPTPKKPKNGIHKHDLALSNGSYNTIIKTNIYKQ